MKIFWQDVLKKLSRRLKDVWLRRIYMFWSRRLEYVFWRVVTQVNKLVLTKMSWRRLVDVSWRWRQKMSSNCPPPRGMFAVNMVRVENNIKILFESSMENWKKSMWWINIKGRNLSRWFIFSITACNRNDFLDINS